MRKVVNISLPEDLKERVDQEIKKGHYASRSEFFRDLLRERIGSIKPSLSLDEIRERSKPILQKAGIKKASVFGSAAKDKLTPDSDIDFLVEMPDGASLFDLVALERKLENEFKYDVDVVSFDGIHPYLEDEVLKSQKPIL